MPWLERIDRWRALVDWVNRVTDAGGPFRHRRRSESRPLLNIRADLADAYAANGPDFATLDRYRVHADSARGRLEAVIAESAANWAPEPRRRSLRSASSPGVQRTALASTALSNFSGIAEE